MRFFYLFSLVVVMVFIQGICEIRQLNKDIDIDYYNCTLNRLTHHKDNIYFMCNSFDIIKFPDSFPKNFYLNNVFKLRENIKIACSNHFYGDSWLCSSNNVIYE